MSDTMLRICGVSKSFSSTKALSDVSFEIGRGEIRGLIGENGSGKSTLSSIIAGIIPCDSGTFEFDEKDYLPTSPVDANAKGVAMVMQEIGTIGGTTVAANIFAGKEKQFSRCGIINYKKACTEAAKILKRVGADDIDPAVRVDKLNLEQRKIIEIAKAVVETTWLLIVDETSNALTKSGRTILYQAIRDMKAKGGSVIFITHDLNELVQVCDSVTILRDGKYIDTLCGDEMKIDLLKQLMVGRKMSENFYRNDYDGTHGDEAVLTVRNVSTDVLENVSFELYKGEILGIGGLADCGMHELGRVIFGLDKAVIGTVTANCTGDVIDCPKLAMKNSMGYVSKNRDTEALVLQSSIRDNICIASLKKLAKHGIISNRAEKSFVLGLAEKLKIKMRDVNQYTVCLSGGNKQKVVMAKWLGNGSTILVMDCPTRGIDIGVKEAIYQLFVELKEQGYSIIMISEELPELIGMSDRMIIMKRGKISNMFDRGPEVTENMVIKDMI